jgi:hypothetical protein
MKDARGGSANLGSLTRASPNPANEGAGAYKAFSSRSASPLVYHDSTSCFLRQRQALSSINGTLALQWSWSATGARGGTASGGGGSWSARGAYGGAAYGGASYRSTTYYGGTALSLWRCRRRNCCRRSSYNLGLCGVPAALLPASVRLLPLSGLPVVQAPRN